MTKSGPIIIIEDDIDDQEILDEVFKKLGYENEVVFFGDGEEAYRYLCQPDVAPFLILSDINMPKLGGLELRKMIQSDHELRIKSIPFIFFTTTANKTFVLDAYYNSVQGFFQKPNTLEELERRIKLIIDYWKESISPNRFED